MRFSIEPREGYLHAVVVGRDTPEQMREFLLAVHSACREHATPKILISMRQSRAVFKPEDYGLNGYVHELVTPACQIAVLGDTDDVNSANEYIEMVARQQGVNVRGGAPEDAGVFTLWDGEEVVYYGRAEGGDAGAGSTIRSRLLDHYYEGANRPTHYSWEICKDPAAREAALLKEHERKFGRLPRNNGKAAA